MYIIRAIVNWTFFLSAPLWTGFVFWFIFLRDVVLGEAQAREILIGKRWFNK